MGLNSAKTSMRHIVTPDKMSLQINGSRVWNEILETASIGGIPGTTGMNRLALSKEDKAVRDLFKARATEIGCNIAIDEIGNIFAILPGRDNTLPPIGIGSHLDTQSKGIANSMGGRFDGILGVVAALEVLRLIKENNIVTHRPIAAINWTNEEGARFESGCTGSAVWAGHMSLEHAYNLKTVGEDSNLYEELCNIGYNGNVPATYDLNPLSAHFELHIEQGPRLATYNDRVGVVTGIQGNRRFQVHVKGEKAHAGSTPMLRRTDALVASAKVILLIEETAVTNGGFATVGVIECENSSTNCVPAEVFFTIDIRNPTEENLNLMEQSIRARMSELENNTPKLLFDIEKIWESPAARFKEATVQCVRAHAIRRFGTSSVAELDSFAGHDSAMTNLRVPTAMIFVPSRDGISHSPEEYTSESQCADGVQILAEAVLSYDQLLAQRSLRNDSAIDIVTKHHGFTDGHSVSSFKGHL